MNERDKQSGLFDVRPVSLASSEECIARRAVALYHHVEAQLAHPALAPDVERVIAPASGKPSTALVSEDGNLITKEFWLVQLRDGRYMRRFLDGTQGPALPSVTDEYVSALIAGGGWKEIVS